VACDLFQVYLAGRCVITVLISTQRTKSLVSDKELTCIA